MEVLKELKELLIKERDELLKFPIGSADELLKIEEEKRELLLKISALKPEELKPHVETVREIKELHAQVKELIVANLTFIEEIFKELKGGEETYTKLLKRG